ncbi:hypothetical protein BDF19DRAFT_438340 [Syncephalis fuscata]|nr:hypothetical protein BDF19DRAFT_438340 [Syncephalis fuscata]
MFAIRQRITRVNAARSIAPSAYWATAPRYYSNNATDSTSVSALWTAGSVRVLEGLRGLWESILRAVPKKKTSHSKKRMRASNKALKNRTDIVACPGCGRDRMMGHICRHCLRDIRHRLKHGENTLATV